MSIIQFSQLLIEVLILLSLLYLIFFKSYFQEKGKNLATKEDVQEITSLVEAVKSQLQFSLQAKLSLRAEEHQLIVDCFARYSAWLSAIMNWTAAGITKDNMSRLGEIRSRLNMLQQDFELAVGKTELFVENVEIESQNGNLMIETLKLQSHAEELTFAMEGIFLEMQKMQLHTPLDQQVPQHRVLLDRILELNNRYLLERSEKYQALLPMVAKQRHAITKHIRALADR